MLKKLAISIMIVCSLAMGARINAQNHPIYEQAKEELGEPGYTLYRVVERIARANRLDEMPWRISFDPEYNSVNAYATDINLVVINLGLYDRIIGDPSALACVIGHEIAHHTELHIPESVKKQADLEKQLQTMKKDGQQEVVNAQQDSIEAISIGSMFGNIGTLFGGIAANNRMNEMKEKIAKLEKEYEQAKLKAQEDQRKQELQADALGLKYMAKAGFEPEGCIRMLKILSRTPHAYLDSESHPSATTRMEQMTKLISETDLEALKLAGENNLLVVRRQPLTYGQGLDGKSLRINSSYGSSDSNAIDNMFK